MLGDGELVDLPLAWDYSVLLFPGHRSQADLVALGQESQVLVIEQGLFNVEVVVLLQDLLSSIDDVPVLVPLEHSNSVPQLHPQMIGSHEYGLRLCWEIHSADHLPFIFG